MTDFRNYSLLQNVDTLTGVRLSLENVNITLDTANFSDMNLTEQFTFDRTSTQITLFVNISSFNVSFVSNLLGEVIVTYNGDYNDTYNSTGDVVSFTNLQPGTYVFTQVLDRFVLGEFSLISSVFAKIINPDSFLIHNNELNGFYNYFRHPSYFADFDYTFSKRQLFFYSGNLFNTDTTQELTNN
jgi:hypothetical protein